MNHVRSAVPSTEGHSFVSGSRPPDGDGGGDHTIRDGWLPIGDISIARAPRDRTDAGLLAWASAIVGPFRIDGIAVRRNREGRLGISFPARRDRHGDLHYVVAPLTEDLRSRIERAVLAAFAEESKRERPS